MIEPRRPIARRATRLALAIVGSLLLAGNMAAVAAESPDTAATEEFSQANRLLFMTDHLQNVATPALLEYSFSRTGDRNDSYEDHVDLEVANGSDTADNGKHVKVDFLSGDRHRYVPDVGNAHGNPVIMMFLQNDVSTLAERTGGSWRYFQKRVKVALEEDARVAEETASYDGQEVPVKRIYLQPFKNEEGHRQALAGEVNKRYVITLSDQVPGSVLEMRSETPNGEASGEDTVDRLALESVTRGKRKDGPDS